MKRWMFLAILPSVLGGCGDDTASEARLKAAANLYGRTGDSSFELERYTSSPIQRGLVFRAKDGNEYSTFTVVENARCDFVYTWTRTNHVYYVNFNLLNMTAARAVPARDPSYSVVVIPGISGSLIEDGKHRDSLVISGGISTIETPIILQRISKFKEMCPGRE